MREEGELWSGNLHASTRMKDQVVALVCVPLPSHRGGAPYRHHHAVVKQRTHWGLEHTCEAEICSSSKSVVDGVWARVPWSAMGHKATPSSSGHSSIALHAVARDVRPPGLASRALTCDLDAAGV